MVGWHIISREGNSVDIELEEDTAYVIYNAMGDSARILRDGRIEVGFSEDGRLTALFEEGNQNKNKCSVKNAALVGYHQKFCGGSYLCGIRNS